MNKHKFFRNNIILLVVVIVLGVYDITPATTKPDSVRQSAVQH